MIDVDFIAGMRFGMALVAQRHQEVVMIFPRRITIDINAMVDMERWEMIVEAVTSTSLAHEVVPFKDSFSTFLPFGCIELVMIR